MDLELINHILESKNLLGLLLGLFSSLLELARQSAHLVLKFYRHLAYLPVDGTLSLGLELHSNFLELFSPGYLKTIVSVFPLIDFSLQLFVVGALGFVPVSVSLCVLVLIFVLLELSADLLTENA